MKSAGARNAPDVDRQIGELVRVGAIQSVDLAAGKVVVDFGDQVSPPIDWLMAVGDVTVWIPPTIGQQVAVVSPEADPAQAFVVGGLPSSAMAPLFLGLSVAIRFSDGAQVSYDPEAGQLAIETPGRVNVTAPAGVTITGPTTIEGDVQITGDVAMSGTLTTPQDVVADGKSLKSHKHGQVQAGSAVSGPPQ